MSIIRYTPNRWLDPSADRLFGDFFPALFSDQVAEKANGFVPRVDIEENEDAIHLSAEIPGVEKDSVKVELDNGVLTISGEKVEKAERRENGIYRSERRYGTFSRSFTLPDAVDQSRIDASFAEGVLELVLHKKPESKPRQINIEGGRSEAKKIDVK